MSLFLKRASLLMPAKGWGDLLKAWYFSFLTARPEKPSCTLYMPDRAKYIFALKVYVQKLIHFTSHLSRDILIFVPKNNMGWISTAEPVQEIGVLLSHVHKSDS